MGTACCKRDPHADRYGKIEKEKTRIVQGPCKVPFHVRRYLERVHEDIEDSGEERGLPFPDGLRACKVLDLGCGTGRDAFVLSQMVGEHGIVVGVDGAQEQIAKAEKYMDYHMEKFGFSTLPNVKFKQGLLEDLRGVKLKEEYFDVIVSNCVMNQCPDKRSLLAQAYDHLKSGGEMYFNDVYASCRIPESLQNKDLWSSCFAGALWWEDLHSICEEIGFHPPLIKEVRPVPVTIEELQKMALIEELPRGLRFASVTYRVFKPSLSDDDASDKAAIYDGHLLNCFETWDFTCDLTFKTGVPKNISKDYVSILESSRFNANFTFEEVIEKEPTHKYAKINPFDLIPDPYARSPAIFGWCI